MRVAAKQLAFVAYMQHRYWRAAEPGRFAAELSATDKRFFKTVPDRDRYEQRFATGSRSSSVPIVLGEILERVDDDGILVGTALGLRPLDPVSEIHNPVVRLVNERELFEAVGLKSTKCCTR